jgi:hypothetical protein
MEPPGGSFSRSSGIRPNSAGRRDTGLRGRNVGVLLALWLSDWIERHQVLKVSSKSQEHSLELSRSLDLS